MSLYLDGFKKLVHNVYYHKYFQRDTLLKNIVNARASQRQGGTDSHAAATTSTTTTTTENIAMSFWTNFYQIT